MRDNVIDTLAPVRGWPEDRLARLLGTLLRWTLVADPVRGTDDQPAVNR
jgi:hypothetical protein